MRDFRFASRLADVTPALTLSISARAKEMQRSGKDVCNFSAGRPEFDTPEHIKAAAKRALDLGETKYGPVGGMPELRQAIAAKLSNENGLAYEAENIAVSNGCKHSLYNLMLVLIEPGDEVLIPAPYWLTFPEIVRLAGGVPVFIPTRLDGGYKFTPDQLRAHVTPRTKALIFNSPGNPTGAVFTPGEIEAIARVVVEKDLLVVSDEIFEKIIYPAIPHVSIASFGRNIFQRTIVCHGFSKIYSMTGWRVGYMAGPKPVIEAVIKAQSHCTSNVCSFAQYGGIACYSDERSAEAVAHFMELYRERRELMYEMVSKMPGLRCHKPDGTFYVFPEIAGTGMKSLQYSEYLLDTFHIATVPGIVFGADDHVRFSFATDVERIHKAADRLLR
jgi:aspartate aminotransferase